MNAQTNKTENEIYSDILHFYCMTNNKTLVVKTLTEYKNSVFHNSQVFHNSHFKTACCKKHSAISNILISNDYSFQVNDEIIEYASIVNCEKLKDNTLNFYKKHQYKPNTIKSVIQAFKNNSTVWIEYYIDNGFDIKSFNNLQLLSIFNVCNHSICKILLNNMTEESTRFLFKNIINSENKKCISRYLCCLAF